MLTPGIGEKAKVYLDYYGLKEPPFERAPAPRFLSFSAEHREALNSLLYGIPEHNHFTPLRRFSKASSA